MSRIGKTIRAPRQSLSAPVSHDSDQARTRELKHLKARVDELEEENERLLGLLDKARIGLKWWYDSFPEGRGRKDLSVIQNIEDALDGGGDTDA